MLKKLFGQKLESVESVQAAIEAAQEKIQKLDAAVDELVTKSTIEDVDAVGAKVSGIESAKKVLEKQIAVLRERKVQLEAVEKQKAEQRACEDKGRLDAQFYAMKAGIVEQLTGIFGKETAREIFRNYRSKIKSLREIEYQREETLRMLPRTPMAALPSLGPKPVLP